jgi:hypothetical protein
MMAVLSFECLTGCLRLLRDDRLTQAVLNKYLYFVRPSSQNTALTK